MRSGETAPIPTLLAAPVAEHAAVGWFLASLLRRAAAVAVGDLATVMACENVLAAAGGVDRYTCWTCGGWADHSHDFLAGQIRTVAEFYADAARFPVTYGDPLAEAVQTPKPWIGLSSNHFHSGFLSPIGLGACLRVRGDGEGVVWRVHHPRALCTRIGGVRSFGVDGDLIDARAAAITALNSFAL